MHRCVGASSARNRYVALVRIHHDSLPIIPGAGRVHNHFGTDLSMTTLDAVLGKWSHSKGATIEISKVGNLKYQHVYANCKLSSCNLSAAAGTHMGVAYRSNLRVSPAAPRGRAQLLCIIMYLYELYTMYDVMYIMTNLYTASCSMSYAVEHCTQQSPINLSWWAVGLAALSQDLMSSLAPSVPI